MSNNKWIIPRIKDKIGFRNCGHRPIELWHFQAISLPSLMNGRSVIVTNIEDGKPRQLTKFLNQLKEKLGDENFSEFCCAMMVKNL